MVICSFCYNIYYIHNVYNPTIINFIKYKRKIDIDGNILETNYYFTCKICKKTYSINKCWIYSR